MHDLNPFRVLGIKFTSLFLVGQMHQQLLDDANQDRVVAKARAVKLMEQATIDKEFWHKVIQRFEGKE